MKHLKLFIIGISAFFIVYGCGGGGGGGSSSTPTNTTFKTFPDGYFTAGYQESYDLSGTDTAGGVHEGSHQVQTKGSEMFMGTQAIAVEELLEWTNTATGAFTSMMDTAYFLESSNGYEFLGDIDDDGITTHSVSTSLLPEYAEIGDFGTVGSYIDDDGWTEDVSWRLESASSGRANLIIYYSIKDEYDVEQITEDHTYLIDVNGNRKHFTLRGYFTEDDLTVTMGGDRN